MQATGSTPSVYIALLTRKFLVDELSEQENADLTEWIEEEPCNKDLFIQVVKTYKDDLRRNTIPEKPIMKPSAKKKKSKVSTLDALHALVLLGFGFISSVPLFVAPC